MHDPNLKGAFRLNMFTDKIDITRDLGWYRESESLTDVDLKFLVVYFEKHYGLSNEKRIEDVIKVVANENRYHPVLDYMLSGKLNDVLSGRLFYADFDFPQGYQSL